MDSGAKQGFVGIDVTDAGDDSLIEDQSLDRGPAIRQCRNQVTGAEPAAERLGP
jgi:hypothetical protein